MKLSQSSVGLVPRPTLRSFFHKNCVEPFLSGCRLFYPLQEVSMKNLLLSRWRFALGVCLASVLALVVSENRASAQQGKYITQASARLSKLVEVANDDGY